MALLEKRKAAGMRVEALENRADLSPVLFGVWEAFCALTRGRDAGFGSPNALRASDISAWLFLHRITGQAAVDYYALILELDAAFLDWAQERQEAKSRAESMRAHRRR